MNQTIEDSRDYDVVCMSFGKEKERGIQVVEAGQKDSFLEATMEIEAKDSELLENNSLKLENGKSIINFADYKKVKEDKEKRITSFAIEKAKIAQKTMQEAR